MTKGYDAKAIKLPKSVKRVAANYLDSHARGAFIRSYVRVIEESTTKKSSKE